MNAAVDIGSYFVVYNFVIGVLVMLSSEKLGQYAGLIYKGQRESIARLTQVSVFTFGAAVAALTAFVYVVFFTLRIGL